MKILLKRIGVRFIGIHDTVFLATNINTRDKKYFRQVFKIDITSKCTFHSMDIAKNGDKFGHFQPWT